MMEQLRVISDFSLTDLSFNLTSVERIISEEWFLDGGPETCSKFPELFLYLFFLRKVQDDMNFSISEGVAPQI